MEEDDAKSNPEITVEKLEFLLQATNLSNIMEFFDPEEKRQLCKSMTRTHIDKGAKLIEQGDTNVSQYYILEKGVVHVFIFDKFIRSIEPGSSFGELGFAFGAPRSASCVCESPCVIWCLDHDQFQSAIAEHLKVGGMFQISRHAADMVQDPDQKGEEYDEEKDKEILEKAGLRESFNWDGQITSPRILPASFMRRLSETEYVDVGDVVAEHMAKFEQNPSKDPYHVEG